MDLVHDSIEDLRSTDFSRQVWESHDRGYVLDEAVGYQYARTVVLRTGYPGIPYQTIRILGIVTGVESGTRNQLSSEDEKWLREADDDYIKDRCLAIKAGATLKHWNRANSGSAVFQWSTEIGWAFTQTPEVADTLTIRFGQGVRCEEPYPVLSEAEEALRAHLEDLDLAELVARIY